MPATNLTSWYGPEELRSLGLRSFGENVCISRKTSIYAASQITIGSNVRVDDFVVLSGGSGLSIGSYVHIACFSGLYANAGIVIEDFVGISSRVVLYTYSDDYTGVGMTNPMVPEAARLNPTVGPIRVGRHAIIGTNSTVLPGVVIGEGAAVGAHTLVARNLEAFGSYLGVPARKLGERKRDFLQLECMVSAMNATQGGPKKDNRV